MTALCAVQQVFSTTRHKKLLHNYRARVLHLLKFLFDLKAIHLLEGGGPHVLTASFTCSSWSSLSPHTLGHGPPQRQRNGRETERTPSPSFSSCVFF